VTRVRGDDLVAIGLRPGPVFGVALNALPRAVKRLGREQALAELQEVVTAPERHTGHPYFARVAEKLLDDLAQAPVAFAERDAPAPFQSWCADAEQGALAQMHNALRLPSAVRGALMPDAHRGYGLPIGGVLATEGTVIPYGVGVDIACRMKLTVLDLPVAMLDEQPVALERALLRETQFGTGATLRERADHDVLDADRWAMTQLVRNLREKATGQLGTSGSGNHFVEFGRLDLARDDLGLAAGSYLSILSHSGSRGPGAQIASHYTKIARGLHPELPKELSYLAWLELDSEPGQEYWEAMNLMGDFAAANHEVVHARLARHLGASALAGVENHHNFAWSERHGGRDVVVHRKGATPAGAGVLGVIPGSMATPGFVVRGRGSAASLDSASHGAGRVMSRTAARERFTWKQVKPLLDQAGVRLLAAGIDENPLVYKDINEVIAAQADLVDVVARFSPRIVRMADSGEKPED
jgi:tRNA-splicing ligase RtcB (3'-phosphate/5'-hydroxy nucleic acid ligase)